MEIGSEEHKAQWWRLKPYKINRLLIKKKYINFQWKLVAWNAVAHATTIITIEPLYVDGLSDRVRIATEVSNENQCNRTM